MSHAMQLGPLPSETMQTLFQGGSVNFFFRNSLFFNFQIFQILHPGNLGNIFLAPQNWSHHTTADSTLLPNYRCSLKTSCDDYMQICFMSHTLHFFLSLAIALRPHSGQVCTLSFNSAITCFSFEVAYSTLCFRLFVFLSILSTVGHNLFSRCQVPSFLHAFILHETRRPLCVTNENGLKTNALTLRKGKAPSVTFLMIQNLKTHQILFAVLFTRPITTSNQKTLSRSVYPRTLHPISVLNWSSKFFTSGSCFCLFLTSLMTLVPRRQPVAAFRKTSRTISFILGPKRCVPKHAVKIQSHAFFLVLLLLTFEKLQDNYPNSIFDSSVSLAKTDSATDLFATTVLGKVKYSSIAAVQHQSMQLLKTTKQRKRGKVIKFWLHKRTIIIQTNIAITKMERNWYYFASYFLHLHFSLQQYSVQTFYFPGRPT